MTLSQLWLWFISSFRFWWYICIPNFRQPCVDTYFEAATCRTCKRATQYGNITIFPSYILTVSLIFHPTNCGIWEGIFRSSVSWPHHHRRSTPCCPGYGLLLASLSPAGLFEENWSLKPSFGSWSSFVCRHRSPPSRPLYSCSGHRRDHRDITDHFHGKDRRRHYFEVFKLPTS